MNLTKISYIAFLTGIIFIVDKYRTNVFAFDGCEDAEGGLPKWKCGDKCL